MISFISDSVSLFSLRMNRLWLLKFFGLIPGKIIIIIVIVVIIIIIKIA